MQIYLNKKTMRIQVICGILEKYEPTEKIESINNKISELHKKLADFQQNVAHPALKEIEDLIKEENDKYVDQKSDNLEEE